MRCGKNAFIPTPMFWGLPSTSTEGHTPSLESCRAVLSSPLDAGRLSNRDLWVPMSFTPVEKKSEGNNFDYSAIARLKPGITMAQAQQDVDRVVKEIQAQYGAAGSGLKLHAYFLPL